MAENRDYDLETPEILSDEPLTEIEDTAHFHFDEYAATLARLIASKATRTPLALGVSGPWGSGKTTLLRRVQRQLDQTPSLLKPSQPAILDFANDAEIPAEQFRVCRTVWFNAWKYADEDTLLVALVRVIVQTMASDGTVNKVIGKLLDPSYPRRDVVNTVLGWFSIKIGEASIGLDTGEPTPTPFAEKTAMLDLFDEAFDHLLAAWVHHKLNVEKIDPEEGVLVVFIDDLDRCLPAKTVQVLEAIKLFLDKKGCIFVLGADASVVRQAVESHYQNAKVTGQNAADYLEKIIQLRFDLPPVPDKAMQAFLQEQGVSPEMLAEWRTLLAAAEVNPRRVKAVFNDIELQWRMLVNSRQTERVQRADFIRWSALLRAAPTGFRERVYGIDDLDLRLKFVQDALRWGGGDEDESLKRTFQEYEKASRLRRVLRQIQAFSEAFDPLTLDAFIHLAAPPAAGAPTAEGRVEVKPGEAGMRAAGRGEARPMGQTWGGLEFVRVPAGRFLMGSKDDNSLAGEDEKPQHTVEISREYWVGRYPVTVTQFRAFIEAKNYKTAADRKGSAQVRVGNEWKESKGANWQHPRGPESEAEGREDHPVVQVSWEDAQAYIQWLNQTYAAELPPGYHFNLPTEAEWEKAARGEYGNEWPWGDEEPDQNRCNFDNNAGDTTPVGGYSPQGDSPYGAADMAGNVWEWCADWFSEDEYKRRSGKPVADPRGPENGSMRVVRGGSWNDYRYFTRCAYRYWLVPDSFLDDLGFRLALSPN